ncbi:MAG: methyltransferase domain-containing protein [Hydrococcus sp. C42_A2020_068]|uniref:class I SAM-dependent methyltransferase n=1 Tax=Pleurocapsa sp. PCC 7327 TaxID=118163 RepID=UPI00029F9C64|nr:class I SAM-dependent methyltransferase [Pleurocapsa sp. PCC 7327]AFY79627.1 methylase involved in ubiquinone/menaquinone biosynthesis [Pleurocapsa sp. PCC 7327]MBF2021202.1 methyltransferase domain-containing protein [Hydrococcus sp. C42_A2020_068]
MTQVFLEKSTVEQWDRDYYHPIALKYYDRAISDMLRMMEVEPGATVLDAGCGPGVHSIRVAKAGYRVCAIDISKTMLEQAKCRVRVANVSDRVEFHQKDLTQLDFPDSSFCYAFSWGVIIHIREAEKALDELARIVEPGGKLALYLTNKTAADHKIESLMRFVQRKPLADFHSFPFGDGIWYHMNNHKLWLWRFDAQAIVNYLAEKGLVLKHRRIGELSEIQRRLQGLPRHLLLRLNNLAYSLNIPPDIATTSLFVFEKKRR